MAETIVVIALILIMGGVYFILISARKVSSIRPKVDWLMFLGIAMIVLGAIQIRVLLKPYSTPSGSMEDTLIVGDCFLANQVYYGYSVLNKTRRFFQTHQPERGDVMVFVYPGDHSKDYIKRCVGVPGDVVKMKNKVLYINGKKPAEPFAKHIDPQTFPRADYFSGWRDNFGPVTVEAGHYFMLGDNRDNSADSRKWGPLDEKLIKGKAWRIYWRRAEKKLVWAEVR